MGNIAKSVVHLVAVMINLKAVWCVPFIATMGPWKCWLEWSKHVKEGPTENNVVENNYVLYDCDTCIANTW